MYPSIEDVAAIVSILSAFCVAIIWLFKKVAIDPLKSSIDALNKTIIGIKEDTDERLGKVEARVDRLEDHDIRHEEHIKNIFKNVL